jgi:Zn-dependent protease/CBS domain-containing protein
MRMGETHVSQGHAAIGDSSMRALRIGKLFGIDIRVDSSWLFIFVLLTWNLVAVFSRWHPRWSQLETLLLAGTASLLFFGGILLHELAHSAVAWTYGLRVRSITLFLFGGVSDIEREPSSPKAELFTAVVGPIASIFLGVGLLLFASRGTFVSVEDTAEAWSAIAPLGPFATVVTWLGYINIMIGLFNLIPGLPLDGGRVLRAILWSATGDLRVATRWASATGQTLGWLFIAGGIAMTFGSQLPFFGTGLVSGIWLAFIGWFLHGAATQATTRLALDDALDGMTVEQLMQRDGPVATPELSVAALVHEHLIHGEDRALPVARDGVPLGVVALSDVRALKPELWASTPVGSIMRRIETLAVATPEEPLAKAFEQLAKGDLDQLPVVSHGRLVGVLRRRDVTRWLEIAWKPAVASTRTAAELRTASRGAIAPSDGGRLAPNRGADHAA